MKTILVPMPKNDSLIAQVRSLYYSLKGVGESEEVVFDLSKITWAHPLLLLPLSVSSIEKNKSIFNEKCGINGYLDCIQFPGGINNVSDFELWVQKYKNYIPVSILKREALEERGRLESQFLSLVYNSLQADFMGVRSGIYYPITELVSNVFDHSQSSQAYIFAQMYPKKNYLDICIVDGGRGLRKTYYEEKGLNLSHADAITEAMNGNSAKKQKDRGFGLHTSRNMVCQGLKGQFMLVTGNALLISDENSNRLFPLPGFNWSGVIIAYRIPKPSAEFDYTQYIE